MSLMRAGGTGQHFNGEVGFGAAYSFTAVLDVGSSLMQSSVNMEL